jgi:hypothetical protein
VNLHGFCVKSCGATVAKLLILLEAVTAGCGATGSTLLILLKNCDSAWFLKETNRGVKEALSGSPTGGTMRVTTGRLMLFMSLDRSFPI